MDKYETDMLVGYTGFVGSNIDSRHEFTYRINSKNKEDAFGINPDLLVYAGLRAEKFLANNDPAKDMATIEEAFEQIKKINPKKLVLISTVDVYKNPVEVDENTEIDTDGLAAYGLNRYRLEQMVRERYEDVLIIRLPGLFGRNIKKNFIYDFINVIPSMLKADKYNELSERSSMVKDAYTDLANGFYKCTAPSEELKAEFKRLGFSALNFTDSRGVFQFYNLGNLWKDINIALENDIKLLNIATEPVSVADIYEALTAGGKFDNQVALNPPYYNYKSVHADLFGGADGYFMSKQQILQEIIEFVGNY